jgi:hypothetical protein
MNTETYIGILLILGILLFLQNRYEEKNSRDNVYGIYESLQKYLQDDDSKSLLKIKKPIIWIPLQYEYNSRNWESFGSRSSFDLNQPYLYLTVKSIITQCEDSFHICIIDDNSFVKLLPEWTVDLNIISNPMLNNMRELGYLKLIFKYGGMIVPPSFLCMRNLRDLYSSETQDDKMFVVENVNRNNTSDLQEFYPDVRFMGAEKHNTTIDKLIMYIQNLLSTDYTAESVFLGNINKWCDCAISKGKINMVCGKLIGTKNIEDAPVIIDDLMSYDYIQLHPQMYGIYIPSADILSRTNYEWYARLSTRQVLESKVILSKYILLSNQKDVVIREPLTPKRESDMISYWAVPLHAPVWGLKPNDLGNNIRKLNT